MKKYEARTQSHVKIDNQRLILTMLYEQGPMSRADLAKALNSSKPTVSKNVEGLLEDQRIIEIGKADNMVGKKAMLLDVNADYGYVLALDLSKHRIRCVISNLKGEWLHKIIEPLIDGFDITGMIDEFLRTCKVESSKVRRVIIAYPGVVGHNNAYYLTNVEQKEILLKKLIQDVETRFNMQPLVKNDVNLGVIAERQYGPHQSHSNLYYISGDIGIGSGIILNGKLFEGDRNAAGEIGFILPSAKVEGEYHTLEERICIQALTDRYNRRMNLEGDFDDFCHAVRNDEPKALSLYEEVLSGFSMAITNVASILDIKYIVVTGRLFLIKDEMVSELQKMISDMTPFETNLELSAIEEATLNGAVFVGIKAMIADMFEE